VSPLCIEILERVREQLRRAVDPEFGEGQRRFFQYEVDTHGVRAPELKAISRGLYREVKTWPEVDRNKLCTELWKSGKLEEGVLACYVYRRFERQCGTCEFKLFERWLDRYVHNWASSDSLSWLLAASISNEPSLMRELPAWTESSNRWKRRASAVALLREAKSGRSTASIFEIVSRMMTDPDDMVQKGVGWLLKETYPKRPREVVAFLKPWRGRASRLLLRYAAEKMTARDREIVLLKPDLEHKGG
jgi:3-methyladenine DNA glycosylase AlkD